MTQSVRVGELTFDVRVEGPPTTAPAVLLLHGFPQNHHSYDEVIPLLTAAGLRSIAFDQRGYSPGARPEGPEHYRLPLLAADALGVLDALGVESAHVVGHDWGAVVAWYLAAQHADRVRSLTALAFPHPGAYRAAFRTDPDQQAASEYLEFFSAETTPDLLLAEDAKGLRELYHGSDTTLTDEQVSTYVEPLRQPGALRAALNWYRSASLLDESIPVGPVPVPATYVWSTDDPSVSTAAALGTAEHVTGSYRLVRLEDASHWQPEEVPERVAQEIVATTRQHISG